jgi:hypothetical protein
LSATTATSSTSTTSSFVSELPSVPTQSFAGNGSVSSGAAVVPRGFLVTNFAGSDTASSPVGATVTKVNVLNDRTTTFFQAGTGQQLTSAIGVWIKGFAFVGSTGTNSGTSTSTSTGSGSILVLDRFGNEIGQIRSPKLTGPPSAITMNGQGQTTQLFAANAADGTVIRINLGIQGGRPVVQTIVQVASDYPTKTNGSGPTTGISGLAYDSSQGVLYVASSADGAVYAVAGAATIRDGTGTGAKLATPAGLLSGPTAMALAPNGDLIVTTHANSSTTAANSQWVEITPQGSLVGQVALEPSPPSAALALKPFEGTTLLGTVNDVTGAVDLWQTTKHKG